VAVDRVAGVLTVTTIIALPGGIDALADVATGEGYGMVARLAADFRSGSNRFDAPGEGLWQATVADALIGVCGVNRDPYADPTENAGRVRRLYVTPKARRQGVASSLLAEVIAAARSQFSILTAFTTDGTAARFYAARGFRPVTGVERRSFELIL
jgi:GNAT superfamily N-acetyltransferase